MARNARKNARLLDITLERQRKNRLVTQNVRKSLPTDPPETLQIELSPRRDSFFHFSQLLRFDRCRYDFSRLWVLVFASLDVRFPLFGPVRAHFWRPMAPLGRRWPTIWRPRNAHLSQFSITMARSWACWSRLDPFGLSLEPIWLRFASNLGRKLLSKRLVLTTLDAHESRLSVPLAWD